MKREFKSEMLRSERIWGLVFIPIHIFALPLLLGIIVSSTGFSASDAQWNLIVFAISCAALFIIMFRFLRTSFRVMTGNFKDAVIGLLLGAVIYLGLLMALGLILQELPFEAPNPNSAQVDRMFRENPNAILAVGVIFAPIVEELMYRGALFGTIRLKSRFLAYIVSIFVFGAIHILQYAIVDFDVLLLINVAQYIPPSIALAYCYERSGGIWPPIFLHAMINLFVFKAAGG